MTRRRLSNFSQAYTTNTWHTLGWFMAPTNPDSAADRWKLQVLDEVFKALASSRELSQRLIYKGARVLRLRLHEFLRASFDIDASLTTFAANVQMASDANSREQMRLLAHRAIS